MDEISKNEWRFDKYVYGFIKKYMSLMAQFISVGDGDYSVSLHLELEYAVMYNV